MSIIERSTNANVRTRKWLYEQLVKLEDYILGSSSGSAVTTLTLEEFGTLVTGEGIEVGMTYIISDAEYGPLIGYSSTVVKPVGGSLTIMNGDTLPTGIEPDVLMIDTGVVTTDIVSGLLIENTNGYAVEKAFVDVGIDNTITNISLINEWNEVLLNQNFNSYAGEKFVLGKKTDGDSLAWSSVLDKQINLSASDNIAPGFRAIIEFHKSQF